MGISSCCGAPIVVEYQSDTTNFSDDNYDLKVPVRVCSKCGTIIAELLLKNVNENEPGRK